MRTEMVIIGPSEGIVRSLQGHWGGGGALRQI